MRSPRRHPRRPLVAVLALAGLAGAAGAAQAATTPDPVTSSRGGAAGKYAQHFGAVPSLHPARVSIVKRSPDDAPGYVLAAPRPSHNAQGGPMMFDDSGQLAWFHPLRKGEQAIDFRIQRYKGQPVITWGQRPVAAHEGSYWTILNSRYQRIAHVHAGAGDVTDLHYLQITPRNTALLIGYRLVRRNLSALGGSSRGIVIDGTIQEVSIKTGRVLWRWSALSHVPLSDSQAPIPSTVPFDAYHINSVDLDSRGRILVSMRHTSTVYAISRKTGRILWRFGGKHSNFKVSAKSRFYFQHDAQWAPHNRVTLFDNGSTDHTTIQKTSAGKLLQLDFKHHRVTLVQAYRDPHGIKSTSQGTYQPLAGGHVFLGWGKMPFASEFSADGTLLFEARFPTVGQQSYSAHRYVWVGHPRTRPAVAVGGHRPNVTLAVAWNGATEVASWRALGGPSPTKLAALGTARRAGFETVLHIRTRHRYVAAQALDANGRVLRTSKPVATKK